MVSAEHIGISGYQLHPKEAKEVTGPLVGEESSVFKRKEAVEEAKNGSAGFLSLSGQGWVLLRTMEGAILL